MNLMNANYLHSLKSFKYIRNLFTIITNDLEIIAFIRDHFNDSLTIAGAITTETYNLIRKIIECWPIL